jgi:hypothetical protein
VVPDVITMNAFDLLIEPSDQIGLFFREVLGKNFDHTVRLPRPARFTETFKAAYFARWVGRGSGVHMLNGTRKGHACLPGGWCRAAGARSTRTLALAQSCRPRSGGLRSTTRLTWTWTCRRRTSTRSVWGGDAWRAPWRPDREGGVTGAARCS